MEFIKIPGNKRSAVFPGAKVEIVQKQHQRSGTLTSGIVKRLLTKSSQHPHGIKVQLENGLIGRVKWVLKTA